MSVIQVRFPGHGADELAAALAERATAEALWLSPTHLGDVTVELGSRVELHFVTDAESIVVRAVCGWRTHADALPTGREAGTGFFVETLDEGAALYQRAIARPGAGARVRIPGQRLVQRLKLSDKKPAGGIDTGALVVLGSPSAPTTMEVAIPVSGERTVVLDHAASSEFAPRNDPSSDSSADASVEQSSDEDAIDSVLEKRPARDIAGWIDPSEDGATIPYRREEVGEPSSGESEDRPVFAREYDLDDEGPPLDIESPTDRHAILARALANNTGDGDDGTVSDDSATLMRPRPISIDDPADNTLGADGFASSIHLDLAALEELPEPDGSRPMAENVPNELAAFPDLVEAPVVSAAPNLPRPFESQSTDVDMLASISAADVVALDSPDDLPSSEAELLELDANINAPDADGVLFQNLDQLPAAAGTGDDLPSMATELFSTRPLPKNMQWPAWSELLDARTMGVALTFGKRGMHSVEFFSWPTVGSKRYSGTGQGDPADPRRTRITVAPLADSVSSDSPFGGAPFGDAPDDDGDVFGSGPSTNADAVDDAFEPGAFEPQGTDPRLNVEGVVAKNVRKSHRDLADDGVVFGDLPDDPDQTRDEMLLPVFRRSSIADPLSGTGEGAPEASSSSEDSDPA